MKEDEQDVNSLIPSEMVLDKRLLYLHINGCIAYRDKFVRPRLTLNEANFVLELIMKDWSPNEKNLVELAESKKHFRTWQLARMSFEEMSSRVKESDKD